MIPFTLILGGKGASKLSVEDVEVFATRLVANQVETVGGGPDVLAVVPGESVETEDGVGVGRYLGGDQGGE